MGSHASKEDLRAINELRAEILSNARPFPPRTFRRSNCKINIMPVIKEEKIFYETDEVTEYISSDSDDDLENLYWVQRRAMGLRKVRNRRAVGRNRSRQTHDAEVPSTLCGLITYVKIPWKKISKKTDVYQPKYMKQRRNT